MDYQQTGKTLNLELAEYFASLLRWIFNSEKWKKGSFSR